jgi:serine protease Do
MRNYPFGTPPQTINTNNQLQEVYSSMRSERRIWAATLFVGLLLGVGIATWLHLPSTADAQERTTVAFRPEESAALTNLESALTRIADTVSPSVVAIRVKKKLGSVIPTQPRTRPRGGDGNDEGSLRDFFREFQIPSPRQSPVIEGEGSGVIITRDGYIMTNDHVVSGADEVEVVFKDGRTATGKVMRDQRSDIALVKVDLKNLPAANMGDSSQIKPGNLVFAIGSPFGLKQSFTMGIVSALGRQETISDMEGARFYPELIQTDASINQGNSGGPLVNSHGEVIGINTAIVSGQFGGGSVGIGFAIPINRAHTIAKQLMEHGKVERGYLGVLPEDLTPEIRESLNIEQGALVRRVDEGTPAWNAGLRAGDVVTEFNGQPIKGQIDLRDKIADLRPGTKVSLKVLRDKRTLTLEATLGSPETQVAQAPRENQSNSDTKLGIEVSALDTEMRKQMKVDAGVLVKALDENSPAAAEGLQVGDVIRSVNGETVNNPEQFRQAVSQVRSGQMMRMTVVSKAEGRTFEQMLMFRMP